MGGNPPMDDDDFLEQWRAADEPADGWRPATPRYGAGLGMEAVPTDLAHFSNMLEADQEHYGAVLDSAITELAQVFPNFSGMAIGSYADADQPPAGAMDEGWAFQKTYFQVWSMFFMRLQQARMGLQILGGAASAAHMAYFMADAFAVDPFSEESGYDVDLINGVFSQPMVPEGESDESIDLVGDAEAEWDAFAERMEDGGQWSEGSPILIGDADSRGTDTRHEGEDGEYVLPRDDDRVGRANRAENLEIHGDEDAVPDSIINSGQGPHPTIETAGHL